MWLEQRPSANGPERAERPPARTVVRSEGPQVHAGCHAERGGRGGPESLLTRGETTVEGSGANYDSGSSSRGLAPQDSGRVSLTHVPPGQVLQVATTLPPDSINLFLPLHHGQPVVTDEGEEREQPQRWSGPPGRSKPGVSAQRTDCGFHPPPHTPTFGSLGPNGNPLRSSRKPFWGCIPAGSAFAHLSRSVAPCSFNSLTPLDFVSHPPPPLAHVHLVILNSSLLLKCTRHTPATGPLHMPFPLPEMLFPWIPLLSPKFCPMPFPSRP